MKGALGMGHISLKKLTAEGSFTGDLGYERRALGVGISLHVGNLEWACLLGTLRDS